MTASPKCQKCDRPATVYREERAFSAVDPRGELVSRTPLCDAHAAADAAVQR